MIYEFQKHLQQTNLAVNTIEAYVKSAHMFFDLYGDKLTKKNLLAYKGYLAEHFKPKTTNLRLLGINKFCDFMRLPKLRLNLIKIQQKTFIENVISDADYTFLKNSLKQDGQFNWYFIVRYLAATGARVSELVQIKVEHIQIGYIDIYGKGGKMRRIYIPENLAKETLVWIEKVNLNSGYLFRNRFGEKITTRGIAHQLKKFAIKYGIDSKVVYPHSFRHRFAKNFLAKYNDIALLADLMGHESIQTTRIYLRKTSNEQQKIVDDVVTW
jgi:integrase